MNHTAALRVAAMVLREIAARDPDGINPSPIARTVAVRLADRNRIYLSAWVICDVANVLAEAIEAAAAKESGA